VVVGRSVGASVAIREGLRPGVQVVDSVSARLRGGAKSHRAVEESMPNPIVQVRGVSKSYRRDSMAIPVLRDISLDVPEGEFLA